MGSSHLLGDRRASVVSSAVLLRIEFTAPQCLHAAGELLPRLSTLTPSLQAPYPALPRKREIAVTLLLLLFLPEPLRWVLSGAREFNGAVYLCCTFPEVAFGGRYPLSMPYGARTFLTHRLSPYARGRSVHSLINSTTHFSTCQCNSYVCHKLRCHKILYFTN